ncbi:MAG: class I SAM-dependent methyltransferase family protein [Myxococcota bacterium]|nr:class I SAM-dependent methyltransferase family protein [Myxococcota bacterium]
MNTSYKAAVEYTPVPASTEPISEVVSVVGGRSSARVHRGQSYAELDGGQGREVFFRPQRYQRNDLGPVRPTVRVAFCTSTGVPSRGDNAVSRECALHDVSQNGVGLELPPDVTVEIGTVLPELVISFDGHEAYRGEARIGSLREIDGKTVAGASLLDSLMNIEDVLQLRDVKSWSVQGSNDLGLGVRQQPWRVTGHNHFKALVGELRLFLEDAARRLGELESALPWHVTHGSPDSPARDALVQRLRSEFVPEVVTYSDAIDEALRGASPLEVPPLKEYSIRYIHDFLMMCPWMHRALHKPLGYPGDYEVMKYVYEANFEGSTLFAKSLSMAFLETQAARAVRARKDLLKKQLSARIDAHASTAEPLRILSVASGPAQEFYELLNERTTISRPIEIVLFDQDQGALSYAFSRLKRLVDSKWAGTVNIVYRYDSIKRLLRDQNIFASLNRSDVIICSGLFDYLQLPTAVSLCRKFYGCLAEGGTAYIGNMTPANPSRWFMELHLDWFLIYRTHLEMMEFAGRAAPQAPTQILDDETGVNPFVVVTRT